MKEFKVFWKDVTHFHSMTRNSDFKFKTLLPKVVFLMSEQSCNTVKQNMFIYLTKCKKKLFDNNDFKINFPYLTNFNIFFLFFLSRKLR